jgi:hypothetical protein
VSKFVIKNAWVRVGGQDISDHVREISVAMSAPAVDVRAMGAAGRDVLQGLREDQFTLTAYSDFAASQIDTLIYPLFSGASSFLVECAAAGTAISATNPKYSGSCILTDYNPISGSVGDAATTPLTLPVQGIISRATS